MNNNYQENDHDVNEDQKRPKRSYWFRMLLYPDNIAHLFFKTEVLPRMTSEYFGILHNFDLKDDVEYMDVENSTDQIYKKPHWHIVFRIPYPMTLMSIQSILLESGIESRFIQYGNCWYDAMYLDHRLFPTKEQYSMSDVFGNTELYRKCLGDKYNQDFSAFIEYLKSLKYKKNGFTYFECIVDLKEMKMFDMFKSNLCYHNMLMSACKNAVMFKG